MLYIILILVERLFNNNKNLEYIQMRLHWFTILGTAACFITGQYQSKNQQGYIPKIFTYNLLPRGQNFVHIEGQNNYNISHQTAATQHIERTPPRLLLVIFLNSGMLFLFFVPSYKTFYSNEISYMFLHVFGGLEISFQIAAFIA